MPRTKNASSAHVSDEEMDDFEEMPEDKLAMYNSSFPVYTDLEGNMFQKFYKFEITHARCLDWKLLESLGIDKRVFQLLKNIGLSNYAKMELDGYDPLCYEFLSTMKVTVESKKEIKEITCRMLGQEFTVDLNTMKDVFGFPISGVGRKPSSFDVETAWQEMTGCNNWKSNGAPNGFIKDPALAIVHKFIAYTTSGKEQANKVNATEVYLLRCAMAKTRICPSSFIWKAMEAMQNRPPSHASLCGIITGLAQHFSIFPSAGHVPQGQTMLRRYLIDLSELRGAQISFDRTTLVPHEQHHCVREYHNAQILAANRQDRVGTSPGPSAAQPQMPPYSPVPEPDPFQTTMPSYDFQMLRDDLRSFCDHYDSTQAAFHHDFGEFHQEVYHRFDTHE